ncbi:MAG: cation diffusion facilitator family transporter [Sphaerochaetaceae bacterium]|nr:cation diffusion facilitator family transporter [Sphaerochaetaceae bacterium]MDD3162991.1 cation diffusion facilitator family transporter [Sphaerochaetaceae bacterium]MDD4396240.1 cation diffusion facilitator family transporter [Sphaerochaetaceae bacterium]
MKAINKIQPRLLASEERKVVVRVSVIMMCCNLFLAALKATAGLLGHSSAMVSDAINSASDVFNTLIVIIGISLATKDSDSDHQYGHERFECIASIILSVLIAISGVTVGYSAIMAIIEPSGETVSPDKLIIIAAIVSILMKEFMYAFTRSSARKVNSSALMANAMDYRTDTLGSLGVLISIIGARLGLPILDPIASLIICLFILKIAVDIFRDAADKMLDKSCDNATLEQIKTTILTQSGVIRIDDLKTRLFGSKIYVDVEIAVDSKMTLIDAHDVSESVHHALEESNPDIKHCMVHVNPYDPSTNTEPTDHPQPASPTP